MKASKEADEEEEPSNDKDDEVKDEIVHLDEKIIRAWIKMKNKKRVTPKVDKKRKIKQKEIIALNARNSDNYDLNVQS